MDYQYNTDEENYLSTKKLFLILGLSVFGVFIVLAFFVFPINNLIRETVSEQAIIISKARIYVWLKQWIIHDKLIIVFMKQEI